MLDNTKHEKIKKNFKIDPSKFLIVDLNDSSSLLSPTSIPSTNTPSMWAISTVVINTNNNKDVGVRGLFERDTYFSVPTMGLLSTLEVIILGRKVAIGRLLNERGGYEKLGCTGSYRVPMHKEQTNFLLYTYRLLEGVFKDWLITLDRDSRKS